MAPDFQLQPFHTKPYNSSISEFPDNKAPMARSIFEMLISNRNHLRLDGIADFKNWVLSRLAKIYS